MTSILLPLNVMAVPFEYVRIGDIDGFGYGDGSTSSGLVSTIGGFYEAANNGSVNADGSGVLYGGDWLPDLNGTGSLATGAKDDFDNRDAAEEGNTKYSALGATLGSGMDGSDFTDIALSTSYDNSSTNGKVWDHNTGTYGTGGSFLHPPSGVPNQPGFVFDFFVATGDIDSAADVYFNMVFGDYDVSPASIKVTSANGTY